MVTREDIESYLLRLEQDAEEVEPGMWVVQGGEHDARMVIHYTPPLLILRMKVMELPGEGTDCTDLYRRLLELNAVDVVHGAYGIEEGDVILSDTLELENLDFNEFQASVDSMQVALASHLDSLSAFRAC
jgi:hypothetical protein